MKLNKKNYSPIPYLIPSNKHKWYKIEYRTPVLEFSSFNIFLRWSTNVPKYIDPIVPLPSNIDDHLWCPCDHPLMDLQENKCTRASPGNSVIWHLTREFLFSVIPYGNNLLSLSINFKAFTHIFVEWFYSLLLASEGSMHYAV